MNLVALPEEAKAENQDQQTLLFISKGIVSVNRPLVAANQLGSGEFSI